jgi:hypothetical protein
VARQIGKQQHRLEALFELTDDAGRAMLLEYAEFLAQRHPRPVARVPMEIPRPETETVVAAVRRLTETFPMLDRAQLLGETSGLLAQHIVHGREAREVIDELEVMFRRHFARFEEKLRAGENDAPADAP